jgi:hypothetical protein
MAGITPSLNAISTLAMDIAEGEVRVKRGYLASEENEGKKIDHSRETRFPG